MRITASLLLLIAVGVLATTGLFISQQRATSDWPQFRGPNRDGAGSAFEAPASWPNALVRQWKVEVGAGHASPILVGNRVYVFARRGEREVLQGLDAATGKTIWETGYNATVTVNPAAKDHGPGPKSTPTFADGRIYTLGMNGAVTAFDAAKGNILWQVPGGSVLPEYGSSASPLVDRGLVIVHVGGQNKGALTAFDAATGKPRWSWSGDGPGYASAVIAEIDGVRQVITLTQKNIVGLAADTGSLLWQRPYTTEYEQNIVTPIVTGRTVIIAGYQKPTAALLVTKKGTAWTVDEAWNNPAVSLYMADAVTVGGSLFGLSHRNSGQYFLLDLKSGKTTWTGQPRQGENAAIVRANDVLFALETDAELVVGKAGAAGFEELRRYKVADTATWAQPVISGNRVFVKDVSTLALWTLR